MENAFLIILDIETTRNSLTNKEEIIELACIKINNSFEVLDEFYTLIKPPCSLSYITKVKTSINDSDLNDKPSLENILASLSNFIKEDMIIAHNAKFDYKVLEENFNRYKLNIKNPFVDSLSLLKTIFPNEKCSLISLKDKFRINKNNHRALDDVYSLREILMHSNRYYSEKFNKHILSDLYKFKVRSQYTQMTLDF